MRTFVSLLVLVVLAHYAVYCSQQPFCSGHVEVSEDVGIWSPWPPVHVNSSSSSSSSFSPAACLTIDVSGLTCGPRHNSSSSLWQELQRRHHSPAAMQTPWRVTAAGYNVSDNTTESAPSEKQIGSKHWKRIDDALARAEKFDEAPMTKHWLVNVSSKHTRIASYMTVHVDQQHGSMVTYHHDADDNTTATREGKVNRLQLRYSAAMNASARALSLDDDQDVKRITCGPGWVRVISQAIDNGEDLSSHLSSVKRTNEFGVRANDFILFTSAWSPSCTVTQTSPQNASSIAAMAGSTLVVRRVCGFLSRSLSRTAISAQDRTTRLKLTQTLFFVMNASHTDLFFYMNVTLIQSVLPQKRDHFEEVHSHSRSLSSHSALASTLQSLNSSSVVLSRSLDELSTGVLAPPHLRLEYNGAYTYTLDSVNWNVENSAPYTTPVNAIIELNSDLVCANCYMYLGVSLTFQYDFDSNGINLLQLELVGTANMALQVNLVSATNGDITSIGFTKELVGWTSLTDVTFSVDALFFDIAPKWNLNAAVTSAVTYNGFITGPRGTTANEVIIGLKYTKSTGFSFIDTQAFSVTSQPPQFSITSLQASLNVSLLVAFQFDVNVNLFAKICVFGWCLPDDGSFPIQVVVSPTLYVSSVYTVASKTLCYDSAMSIEMSISMLAGNILGVPTPVIGPYETSLLQYSPFTCSACFGCLSLASTTPAPVATTPAGTCAAVLTCSACTEQPSCGWCNGACRTGTFSAPTTGISVCAMDTWAWVPPQCVVVLDGAVAGVFAAAPPVGQMPRASISVFDTSVTGPASNVLSTSTPSLIQTGQFLNTANCLVNVGSNVSAVVFVINTNQYTAQIQHRWDPGYYSPANEYPGHHLSSQSYTCDPCAGSTPISCNTATGPGSSPSPINGFACSGLQRIYTFYLSTFSPNVSSFALQLLDINSNPAPTTVSYSFSILRAARPTQTPATSSTISTSAPSTSFPSSRTPLATTLVPSSNLSVGQFLQFIWNLVGCGGLYPMAQQQFWLSMASVSAVRMDMATYTVVGNVNGNALCFGYTATTAAPTTAAAPSTAALTTAAPSSVAKTSTAPSTAATSATAPHTVAPTSTALSTAAPTTAAAPSTAVVSGCPSIPSSTSSPANLSPACIQALWKAVGCLSSYPLSSSAYWLSLSTVAAVSKDMNAYATTNTAYYRSVCYSSR